MRALIAAALVGLVAVGGSATFRPATAQPPTDLSCDDWPCFLLKFNLTGSGSGSVYTTNSDWSVPDDRIDCQLSDGAIRLGSKCEHDYPYTGAPGGVVVYYVVDPGPGNQVCAGSDCSDGPAQLTVAFVADQTIAYQMIPSTFVLTVKRSGTGSGGVFGTPPLIACGEICFASIDYGTTMLLTAVPGAGSVFTSWKGACAGQSADCLISVIANTTTTAVFTSTASPGPTVTASQRPVTPSPAQPGVTPSPPPATPTEAAAGPTLTATSGATSSSPSTATALSPTPSNGDPSAPVTTTSDDSSVTLLLVLLAGTLLALGVTTTLLLRRRRS